VDHDLEKLTEVLKQHPDLVATVERSAQDIKALIDGPRIAKVDLELTELQRRYTKLHMRMPHTLLELDGFIDTHNWQELKAMLQTGRLGIQKYSFEYDQRLINLFADRADHKMMTFYNIGVWLGPLVCVVLSLAIAWWLLFLVPFWIYWFWSRGRNHFADVMFKGALLSERAFCFLYWCGQIAVVKDGTLHVSKVSVSAPL
jgi:hypothetical protein